jgi:acylphosphatase
MSKKSMMDVKEGAMPATVCVRAIVHGYVQGVGFRYFTLRRANLLGLQGYVRNQWDGTVEVVAEGPRELADQLLEDLRRGPIGSYVERVEVQEMTATGTFDGFQVRF